MSRPRHRGDANPVGDVEVPCGPGESSRGTYAKVERIWQRWCAANGIAAWPARERDVLRFLQLHHDAFDWTHAYCNNVVAALQHHNTANGDPPVRTPAVKAWLAGVRRRSTPRPATPPLTAEHLAAFTRPFGAPDVAAPVVRLRLAIQAAAELHTDLDQLTRIRRADITATTGGWVLPTSAGPVALREDPDDPFAAGSLVGQLMRHPTATRTLLKYPTSVLRDSLDCAVRRAGLSAQWATTPWPGAGLDDRQRRWLTVWCDRTMLVAYRTVTWALVGAAIGARNDELSRLTIDDTAVVVDDHGHQIGLRVHVGRSKADQGGERPHRLIRHGPLPGHAGRGCTETCAACAWVRWVRILDRVLGHRSGLVFPAFNGWSVRGRLRNEVATQSLRKLAGALADLDANVSSRSVRVFTATSMRGSGASLDEIAELVGWRDFNTLVRYLRFIDPFQDQFHLPV